MMKLVTTLFVASMVVMVASTASAALTIDNFEGPVGWVFDNLTVTPTSPSNNGSQYYALTATVTNGGYYAGGFGQWIDKNVSAYSDFSIWVKGDGRGSTLKYEIEETDGDKWGAGGWGMPTYTPINWTGWNEVRYSFSSFTLLNPGVGDGTWNGNFKQYNIIASVSGATGNGEIDLGVEDMTVIPEPTSMLLLGSGLVGMLLATKKRVK